MLNPVPEAAAEVMFSAAFPEFVKVMFCEELPPTFTLPKLTLDELTVS